MCDRSQWLLGSSQHLLLLQVLAQNNNFGHLWTVVWMDRLCFVLLRACLCFVYVADYACLVAYFLCLYSLGYSQLVLFTCELDMSDKVLLACVSDVSDNVLSACDTGRLLLLLPSGASGGRAMFW